VLHSLVFALLLNASAQTPTAIGGVVVDPSGAPVPDAAVRLESAGAVLAERRTANDGRFEFTTEVTGEVRVVVTAGGFAEAVASAVGDARDLKITLQPAPFFEAVNVTSSRADSPRSDPTATIVVLTSSELLNTAAATLDDALKVVPGFTLFRRTSSRVSNPTAQGITLRGLGGTGSSRSLVLADGVPLNDAFGGWVYWDKLPQAAIDRVEVERGSGGDLYGADAVGGVVQIVTLRPRRASARALLEGGGLGTGRASAFAAGRRQNWDYNGAAQWFTTDGYRIVANDDRQTPGIKGAGPIDVRAGSTHQSALVFLGYQAANGWHAHARGNVFAEHRNNGTPAVTNRTAARQASAEVAGGLGQGLLSARIVGGTQGYDQTFSAVSADRAAEDLNRTQRVPTRVVGAALQWTRSFARNNVLAGTEARFIKGDTQEIRFAQGRILGGSDDGGTQHVGSVFVQDTMMVNDRLTIVGSGHADWWHTQSQNTDYNKTLASVTPRAAFSYRLGGVAVRGSAYGGFRAPTLNELYRDFRSGNTQTNHNEALRPEYLKGADLGLFAAHRGVSARLTGFYNLLDDVITNVTLSTTPSLITKQRQNADTLRSTGIELEGEARLGSAFSFAFSSAIVRARFKGNTSLRDNRVPQVPDYNVGVTARYTERRWTASAQVRLTGPQFEDDLNQYLLRRATVVDLLASRSLAGKVSLFVAIENALDAVVDVGRTPVLTIGLPRVARAGVQLSLP
jgi:outer membrane cobalamin receptor